MKGQKCFSATLKFNLLSKLDTVGLNTGIFISILVLCNEHNETLLLVQDGMLYDCISFLLLLSLGYENLILFRLSLYFNEIFIKLYGTAAFHFE